MASPNLVPIDFSPSGDTFQYFVNLTNNLVSLANAGVYTNGNPTSANANVVIVGSVTSTYFVGSGNNSTITFYNDNSVLTGQINPTSNSIVISTSNVSNKMELFSNGTLTVANVKIATVTDIGNISNTVGNTINTAVNNALSNAYAYTDMAVPSGTVLIWAGNTAPTGFYECDGTAKSRTTDVKLFAAIGTIYGSGNGSNTFNIPQLQGEFIRGWDHGRGVDTGRTLGSYQVDALKTHTHTGTTVAAGDHTHTASVSTAGDHNHTINDPGHAHSVNDPGHSHGVYDPGHAHSVNDPGHSHGYIDSTFTGRTGNNGNAGIAVDWTTSTNVGRNTNGSGTGVSINGAGTNIGIYGSGTNISIGGSTTHISLANSGSHTHSITLVNAGAHTHTLTTNATGDVETRPRNIAMMYIIKR